MTLIYHGTPLTPRAALLAVLTGRAACVSFFRPDDVEAVEAVCPYVMFRQRRFQFLDAGHEARTRMGSGPGLDRLLQVARAPVVPCRSGGCHPRCAGRAVSAQRRDAQRLAVRTLARNAAVAHGWPPGTTWPALRALRPGSARLDRRSEEGAGRLRCLPAAYGRGCKFLWKQVASAAHDARRLGCATISLRYRRQHQPRAERAPL